MKVSKVGSSRPVSSTRRKKTPSGKGSAFAEQLKEATGSLGVTEGAEPSKVIAADSVLSVQETDDDTRERSRGLDRMYGEGILDRLEDIRHGLLAGALPKEKLVGLAQSMRARRRQSDDPRLNRILDEIELRAEVEIAKLTREA